jgi:membrane protease YdiL (CAAX protease family)
VVDAAAAGLGLILFALFSHQGFPLIAAGAAGLLAAAFAIQRSCTSLREIPALFGLSLSVTNLPPILVGCALGAGLGLFYRISFGMTIVPNTLEPFVLAACCIGAAEEFVYRGWMQERLRELGRPAAVLLTAAAHTAYKTALFTLLPSPIRIDFKLIVISTLAAGVLFGMLREYSRSVVPPVAAHVMFDFLVYGAAARAPWWVWM